MSNGDDQKIEYTVGDRLLIQQAVDGVGRIEAAFKEYLDMQATKDAAHDKVHEEIDAHITEVQNNRVAMKKIIKIAGGAVSAVAALAGAAKALGLF